MLECSNCIRIEDLIIEGRCSNPTSLPVINGIEPEEVSINESYVYRSFYQIVVIESMQQLPYSYALDGNCKKVLELDSIYDLRYNPSEIMLIIKRLVEELKREQISLVLCCDRVEDQCLNELSLSNITVVSNELLMSYEIDFYHGY
jgi:hypothetical protein